MRAMSSSKLEFDFVDEPAQTSRVNAQITRSGGDDAPELPHRSAHLVPMIIELFEWGQLVVGRRNERLNVVRAAMAEHLVE